MRIAHMVEDFIHQDKDLNDVVEDDEGEDQTRWEGDISGRNVVSPRARDSTQDCTRMLSITITKGIAKNSQECSTTCARM